MKRFTKFSSTRFIAFAILLSGISLCCDAKAQDISWSGPHPITGDQDVINAGTVVGAWLASPHFPSVNGVTFYPASWVAPAPWPNANTYPNSQVTLGTVATPSSATHVFEDIGVSFSPPFSLLSSNYQEMLSWGVGVVGGSLTLTLTGLIAGQQYAVETWANSSNPNDGFTAGNITETVSGSVGTTLQTNPTGQDGQLGQYSIGTFTAPASGIESFTVDGSSNFFNDERSLINAVLVESLPAAVPEPATWFAGVMAVIAFVFLKLTRAKQRQRAEISSIVTLALTVVALASSAHAQFYVSNGNNNTVGEYNSTTGAAMNPSLVTGLSIPTGVALAGNNLFVANIGTNAVGEYNATTGAVVNSSFITGLNVPRGVVVSGSNLLVVNQSSNTIGQYSAVTGTALNPSFVTGLNSPTLFVLSNGNLYVANNGNGTIGEYNAITGAALNPSFVTGLNGPVGLTFLGGNLFVVNNGNGMPSWVSEYNATTGAIENPSFISGLSGATDIAVANGDLLIGNSGTNTIRQYDAANGALLNASFVTGLSGPYDIEVTPSAVPEPATWTAAIFAIGGCVWLQSSRKRIRAGLIE